MRQVICQNNADPVGAINLLATNELSGDATITLTCGATSLGRRSAVYWAEPIF